MILISAAPAGSTRSARRHAAVAPILVDFTDTIRSLPRRGRRIFLARQLIEHRLEILRFAEITIDRGEAHIGHVVERAQRLHHHLAHGLGGNFTLALALELAHDLGHRLVDPLGLDRTLAQRDLHRAQQLVAVERHAAAVALDHHELAQLHALERREAEIAGQAHTATTDDGGVLGRPGVLHLRIEAAAIRTAHASAPATSAVVDRKPADQLLHFFAHRGFGERILLDALLREDIKHLDDQLAHLLELGNAEAAGGAGGSAEAYPRRHRRLLRIERDAVLVAGDARAAQRPLRDPARHALGPQVDQHEVRIGATGDDVET